MLITDGEFGRDGPHFVKAQPRVSGLRDGTKTTAIFSRGIELWIFLMLTVWGSALSGDVRWWQTRGVVPVLCWSSATLSAFCA